ncbi:hypothetical protein [Montanilutibacter psychrotolerans]|uniref:Uncharacterized protein n=1 Tax=Montanilutibacter psychrotolerans TaxID=1327343 RepID=A0A3M8SR64_9GAMM|nr:hypothetical protein [Lysobacter psychrotolerans]RNF83205.1 hypothetical protein EER27_11925 [Lysobacter psychrotolerans]
MERAILFVVSVLALMLFAGPCLGAPSACQRISFHGEVVGQDAFRVNLGMGLTFRLEPSGDESGWEFEIGPTQSRSDEWDAYIYTLTPPWRGRHATMLNTSYATPARQAATGAQRHFWFLLRRADAPAAKAALDDVLWPKTDEAQESALMQLGDLPRGSGELTILAADIEPGLAVSNPSELEPLGRIHRLAFRVALTLPEGFSPAATLAKDVAPCPDPHAWAQQWQ